MPSHNGHQPRTTVEELGRRLRTEMIPLNRKFGYFLILPVADEDLRQYLHDPIAALPPAVCELVPETGIVLAPYLERGTPRSAAAVVYEKPSDPRLRFSAHVENDGAATLFFTIRDEEVSDYHYYLFNELAGLISRRLDEKRKDSWHALLREEIGADVHGEVDERSWREKQNLLRKPKGARMEGAAFREYARQSFEDTVTLFLHGICCDIDVETGPRQLPSRFLRKRLEALKQMFPPPEGHAVFPEDLPHHH
jgi:hypothetical protein